MSDYDRRGERLVARSVSVEAITAEATALRIALPSWGRSVLDGPDRVFRSRGSTRTSRAGRLPPREENRVLKEQLKGRRLRLTDAQRRRLASKGKALGRRLLAKLTIVSPGDHSLLPCST